MIAGAGYDCSLAENKPIHPQLPILVARLWFSAGFSQRQEIDAVVPDVFLRYEQFKISLVGPVAALVQQPVIKDFKIFGDQCNPLLCETRDLVQPGP